MKRFLAAAAASVVVAPLLASCGPLTYDAVKRSWEGSYNEYNSLKALALNVCEYEAALIQAEKNGDPSIISQRQSYLLLQKQQYAATKSRYEAALANPLARGLTKPLDLPRQAPDLSTMKEQVCR